MITSTFQCLTSHVSCSSCFMFDVSCFVLHVSCRCFMSTFTFHVSCSMFMFHVRVVSWNTWMNITISRSLLHLPYPAVEFCGVEPVTASGEAVTYSVQRRGQDARLHFNGLLRPTSGQATWATGIPRAHRGAARRSGRLRLSESRRSTFRAEGEGQSGVRAAQPGQAGLREA